MIAKTDFGSRFALMGAIGLLLSGLTGTAAAQGAKATEVKLGALKMKAPSAWLSKKPKFAGIVSHEFSAPAAKGDPADGRITIGSLGGGLQPNIDRWSKQFSAQTKSSVPKASAPTKTVKGVKIYVVDVEGTFSDKPRGPFGPTVARKRYRMLAAALVSDKGSFYVKFYGPEKTVANHKAAFDKMLADLEKE